MMLPFLRSQALFLTIQADRGKHPLFCIEVNMTEVLQKVDHTAIQVNQICIILLLAAAFVFNLPLLAGLVGVVMLLGTLLRRPGFGFLVYGLVLRPLGWVRPNIIPDHPQPHLFAQGFGSVVVLGGTLALLTGAAGLGWGLAWLVIFLATLNLLAGFCVGCAMYYWLGRLNVPGFDRRPPQGVFPGMRPKAGQR
jgi:hypothetical protein